MRKIGVEGIEISLCWISLEMEFEEISWDSFCLIFYFFFVNQKFGLLVDGWSGGYKYSERLRWEL